MKPRVAGALMTGLDVLEALGKSPKPVGVSELARMVDADKGNLLRNMDMITQARPLMRYLVNVTGESAHLAHKTSIGGVYLAGERLARRVTVETEIGSPVAVMWG